MGSAPESDLPALLKWWALAVDKHQSNDCASTIFTVFRQVEWWLLILLKVHSMRRSIMKCSWLTVSLSLAAGS